MRVRGTARKDIEKWRALAPDCELFIRESMFKAADYFDPPTGVPCYDDFMKLRFARGEAYACMDDQDNWLGAIAILKNEQRIALLAVANNADFDGVAMALIDRAMKAFGGQRKAVVHVIVTGNARICGYAKILGAHGFRAIGDGYENGVQIRLFETE